MRSLVSQSGVLALLLGVVCFTNMNSGAEAGGRRWSCNNHYGSYSSAPNYNNSMGYSNNSTYVPAAPVMTDSTAEMNGRQRYQSGYQVPATAPAYYGPMNSGSSYNYNSSNPSYYVRHPVPGSYDDVRANRKIQDGRVQH